jgi:hypothetical protein
MPHKAAPAIGVFPARFKALAVERVTQGVRWLGTNALRKRRVGDHLVAARVVTLVQGSSHDLGEPSRPERGAGRLSFRLHGSHILWPRFPAGSPSRRIGNSTYAVLQPPKCKHLGLGCSDFARLLSESL